MKTRIVLAVALLAVSPATSLAQTPVVWGGAGMTPVSGDYDGDGRGDFALYHEASGCWYVLSAQNSLIAWAQQWGGPGLNAVPGDFDGDGVADLAVYNTSDAGWYVYSLAQDAVVAWAFNWGWSGAEPVPADYDGDGKTDMAVYSPDAGEWYVYWSSDPGPVTVGTPAAFRSALESDGFLVQSGIMTNLDILGFFNAGLLPSCYGNNNDSPYAVLAIPKAPDQTAPNQLPWSFRLRPDEAVVFVGKTPPEAVYYSFQTFLGIRLIERTGLRQRVFANLGDTVNNFTIRSSGTPNGNDGNPFDKDTMLIITPDRGVEARVRAAARGAGYSDSIINTETIPSSMLRMGVETNADELIFLARAAFFTDTNAAAAYFSNPGAVFRITPNTTPTLAPYPAPTLRVRGTGTTEWDYNPAVEDLRDAILAAYPGYAATQLVTGIMIKNSSEAIQFGWDVLGETRDTTYVCTEEFSLTNNEFAVFYGVNHAASGKATYSSMNVYGMTPVEGTTEKEFAGVASVNSVQHFAGTAQDYIPGHPMADKLYAYKLAWSNPANDPHCLVIPQPWGRLKLRVLMLASRAYIEPGKDVGPEYFEILYDRAIVFRPLP